MFRRAKRLQAEEMIYRPRRYEPGKLPVDAARKLAIVKCGRGGMAEQPDYSSHGVLIECDLAVPTARLDLIMPGVKKMIGARMTERDIQSQEFPADAAFRRSIGAGLAKARLIPPQDVVFADSQDRAIAVFKSLAEPDRKIVLEGTPPAGDETKQSEAPALQPEAPARPKLDAVEIEPKLFWANRVVFQIPAEASGWLFYADAYDPAWKALVDEQPAKVYPANVGFKAVRVPKGAREVTFYYDGGWRDKHCLAFMAAAALLAVILTGLLFAAPWLLKIDSEADVAAGAEDPSSMKSVRNWSALAWVVTLAGGLFLFTDSCVSLVVVPLAMLAVFFVQGSNQRVFHRTSQPETDVTKTGMAFLSWCRRLACTLILAGEPPAPRAISPRLAESPKTISSKRGGDRISCGRWLPGTCPCWSP